MPQYLHIYHIFQYKFFCFFIYLPVLINSLFFSTLFQRFTQQKSPGDLTVPGYLTLRHTVSYDTKFILLSVVSDYSITVATRPDPTVRPPSRYQTGVLRCANGDFSCDLCGKIRIFRCVRVVLGNFVIMVLSLHFLSTNFLLPDINRISAVKTYLK